MTNAPHGIPPTRKLLVFSATSSLLCGRPNPGTRILVDVGKRVLGMSEAAGADPGMFIPGMLILRDVGKKPG
jgi:hypothetical protein